jgi:hypothetical protein
MYSVKKIQVGCQAAIAGKPAPTVDRVQPGEIGRLSGRHRWQASSYSGSCTAVGDGSAVRLAPTIDRVRPWGDGAVVRPSSLASQLLQWIVYSRGRWVGCQAAIASRLAPTVDRVRPCGDGEAVRPSSLASQLLQWIGYGRGRWVGFEAAIAVCLEISVCGRASAHPPTAAKTGPLAHHPSRHD